MSEGLWWMDAERGRAMVAAESDRHSHPTTCRCPDCLPTLAELAQEEAERGEP